MRQTHDLWHEMQAAYPDADEFVMKLNACVQAARSVTFVLQKELRHRDWFEEFYEPWQSRMRDDERLRWLIQARNAIEKEGDLDTHSVAHVSVAVTDHEQPVATLDVDALASPEDVAKAVKLRGLPERIQQQAVMVVERRWTVPDLPDDELLDALGHCYGILASLVRAAHERCGVDMQTFGGETHGGRHSRESHPSGRLECMLPTSEMRTAYWHLGEDSPMLHKVVSQQPTEERLDQAKTRYGLGRGRFGLRPGLSPLEQAKALHELGKAMLVVDGYHVAVAWIQDGANPLGQYSLDPQDQQEKIVKTRWLADEVRRTGADTVIYTAESWFAEVVEPDDPRFAKRAGEREDRQEVLTTYLLQRSGEHREINTVFGRDQEDGIVLQETDEQPTSGRPFFNPILRVWEEWPESP